MSFFCPLFGEINTEIHLTYKHWNTSYIQTLKGIFHPTKPFVFSGIKSFIHMHLKYIEVYQISWISQKPLLTISFVQNVLSFTCFTLTKKNIQSISLIWSFLLLLKFSQVEKARNVLTCCRRQIIFLQTFKPFHKPIISASFALICRACRGCCDTRLQNSTRKWKG